jgi:hypothetical protein
MAQTERVAVSDNVRWFFEESDDDCAFSDKEHKYQKY